MAGWFFVGSPTVTTAYSEFSELNPVIIPQNNASIFYHNEQDSTSTVYNGFRTERYGWKIPASFASTLANGRGARIYVRSQYANATFETQGTAFTGNKNFGVTFTTVAPGGDEGGGWNLLANPYPSAIDWDAAGWARTNVDNAIYVWNQTLGYGSYINGNDINMGPTPSIIPSSQAFFVHANAASPVLSCTEAVKTATNGTFIRAGGATNRLRVKLTSPAGYEDNTIINFRDQATRAFDTQFDAYKLTGSYVNLSTTPVPALKLSINCLAPLLGVDSVPLNALSNSTGRHTLRFTDVGTFVAGTPIVLRDRFAGTVANITDNGSYEFDITANPASNAEGRFMVIFGDAAITATRPTLGAGLSFYPNPAKGHIIVTGTEAGQVDIIAADGRTLATHQVRASLEGQRIPTQTLAKGTYQVRLRSQSTVRTERLVIE